ncbi:peptide chain release factor 2 [Hyaloraphidium curvatum]|nr:peptide chain release factor 2 [Hyaloraphidium curvatum]
MNGMLASVDRETLAFETLRDRVAELRLADELAALEDSEEAAKVLEEAAVAVAASLEQLPELLLLTLLGGPYDSRPAYLTITGAGNSHGEDTHLFILMLERMYLKWAEAEGRPARTVLSVDLEIDGPYAYGLLRCDHGVHRCAWVTEFNRLGKRQTTFAAVEVVAVLDDADFSSELEIAPQDLRITTMSGPGGQSVNRTESAVRIEHLPTGIQVRAEEHPSQHQNRRAAMARLRARLAVALEEQRAARVDEIRGEAVRAGEGEVARHYLLLGNRRVKDSRTGHETFGTEAVLDGELDGFLRSYLRWRSRDYVAALGKESPS